MARAEEFVWLVGGCACLLAGPGRAGLVRPLPSLLALSACGSPLAAALLAADGVSEVLHGRRLSALHLAMAGALGAAAASSWAGWTSPAAAGAGAAVLLLGCCWPTVRPPSRDVGLLWLCQLALAFVLLRGDWPGLAVAIVLGGLGGEADDAARELRSMTRQGEQQTELARLFLSSDDYAESERRMVSQAERVHSCRCRPPGERVAG